MVGVRHLWAPVSCELGSKLCLLRGEQERRQMRYRISLHYKTCECTKATEVSLGIAASAVSASHPSPQ
jgi:hypothetical protein